MTARGSKVWRILLPALAALWIAGLWFGACAPPVYFAKATHGRVIDAETKQPISGAVVIANWDLFHELVGGGSHGVCSMQVAEAVTDPAGHFVVPGWGPKVRPWLTLLDDDDPSLTIFKSGYVPTGRSNYRSRNTWVRFSEWDGQTWELTPFHGTPRQRSEQLDRVINNCRNHRSPLRATYNEVIKDADSTDFPRSFRSEAQNVLLDGEGWRPCTFR
jgi:hypothetical protein